MGAPVLWHTGYTHIQKHMRYGAGQLSIVIAARLPQVKPNTLTVINDKGIR
jgi:hypothetical protein